MPDPPDEPPPPTPANTALPAPHFQPGTAPSLKGILSQDPLLKLIPIKRSAAAASITDAKRKRLHSTEDEPCSSSMDKELDVWLQQEIELLEDKDQEGWVAAWTERAQAERSLLWGPLNMQTLRTFLREGKASFLEAKRGVAAALNSGRQILNTERGLNLPLIPLAEASTPPAASSSPTRGEQESRVAQQHERSQGWMAGGTMANPVEPQLLTMSTQGAPNLSTKTCNKCEREGLPCDGDEPCQQCYARGMFHLCIYTGSPPLTLAPQQAHAQGKTIRHHTRPSMHRAQSEQGVTRAPARRLWAGQETLARPHSDPSLIRFRVSSPETQKRQPEVTSRARSPAVQPSTALQPQPAQREHQQQMALPHGHQSASNTTQDGGVSQWQPSTAVSQTGFAGMIHFRPPPSIPARASGSIVPVQHTRTASFGSDEQVHSWRQSEPRRQSGEPAGQQQQQAVPIPRAGPYSSISHLPHQHVLDPSVPNSPVHRFSTPAWRSFLPLIPDCLAGLSRFLHSIDAVPGAGTVAMPRSQPGLRPVSSGAEPGAGPAQS